MASVLEGCEVAAHVCGSPEQLYRAVNDDALLLVITEEGLAQCDARLLLARIRAQPAWSNIPVIVLAASARAGHGERLKRLAQLGNVTVISRPIAREAMAMAVGSALHSRQLQFKLRDQLTELGRYSVELERRVDERSAALAREVDERKRIEAALLESRRLESLGRLTGGIAHDFNNMLQVVSGGVQLLRALTAAAPDPRLQRTLDSIERASGHGAKLTQQLLAYGRRQALSASAVDLNERMQDMAVLLRHTVGREIRLTIEVPDGLWPVRADATQLEMAVLNLVLNARDAMPDGGQITLSLRNCTLPEAGNRDTASLRGDYVCIALSDQGCGMDKATLGQAFEPFFTTKAMGKGTGLGLSQVQGFATQSGGHAFIQSDPNGTTVSILLPRCIGRDGATAATAPAPQLDDLAAGSIRLHGLTVLCVEDDPLVAEVAAGIFDVLGMKLIAAANADEALEVDLDGVDAVLSDVMMPGSMDGIGLAAALRRARPDLPVVLASGYISSPERLQSLDVGFVQKPYSGAHISAALLREIARMGQRSRPR
ncbi:response regulator [Massilia sp. GCM10020059]|uniref:histidine kinase n=1 Tax=Massilia agrisoli TaxID=2892444 RepID=A0ABS8IT86_9BURK|nr:response regulator [Massilia agrisoli]MCC6071161.1 response regulator [Massilia agrisoli]